MPEGCVVRRCRSNSITAGVRGPLKEGKPTLLPEAQSAGLLLLVHHGVLSKRRKSAQPKPAAAEKRGTRLL